MLSAIVSVSLRFRGVVIALACVAIGYGLYVADRSKFDVFPEFAPPQVVIPTEAPGLSSEQVEALVTRPVESAINGVVGLQSLRSTSIQGLSLVTATFADGMDIYRARQMVGETLAQVAGQMPQGVSAPTMAPLTSSTSVFLTIGLTSTKRTPMELRTFADWTLRPRLLGVPGVAKAVSFGGEVRQLQVQLRPERLIAYGLSVTDVLEAARQSTGIRGTGFVENQSQRIVIQAQGQSLTSQQLGEVVVAHRDGLSVRLKDVADVTEGGEPKLGDASIMGKRGVMLVLSSQYQANTTDVTAAVEKALTEMKPTLQAEQIELHPALFRPADFISTAIGNVKQSLLIGGILVTVVLFLFLFNVRTGFISLTAIPLSLLMAIIALHYLGISLNTLTLGGLAIALGEVVDDAIIDVENIFRRLRENRDRNNPRPVFRVVLEASIEVRSAVIYATFVVALVFLPVLAMSGIQGRLFAPLGIAYILATLSSLLVALTLTPALSYALFATGAKGAGEPPFAHRLKRIYRRWLDLVIRRSKLMVGVVVIVALATAATLPFFGGSFLPEFQEGQFLIHMALVPGTSIEQSLQLGDQVTKALLKNPHIRSVDQRVGRGQEGDDYGGSHDSEFEVVLKPLHGEDTEVVQAEIRWTLAGFPGAYFSITSFLSERIEETISGVTAQVVIKVVGDDLDVIDRKAQEIARVVGDIPGAADVQVESPPGMPQLVVKLRPDRLTQFGFQPVEVLDAVQTAYQGSPVAQVFDADRVFDVAVILPPKDREDPEQIGSLLLSNGHGQRLPLRALADIYQDQGRYSILHDGTRRRQAVTCNVRGRDVASFVAEAQRKIAKSVSLPGGTYTVFTGAAEAQAQARSEILTHSLIAGVGIVLLLAIVFGSARNLLLVLMNLPLALVGGVLAVFFTGGWLSVGSLVGFVTLFGITTRNSIMMISHFEHLVNQEGMTWGEEAALRGASERLVPILMTGLVTALGLLPLAIGSGSAGREIEGPMAIVILGGLATSTVLNLLVLPTLALRYGRVEKD